MNIRAIGVIKQLARRLAYQTLHDVVGRSAIVADRESLEATLLGLLDRNDCTLISPEPDAFVIALLKYGLIDATLEAPRALVESIGERGLHVVKATGFLANGTGEDDWFDAMTCLQDLLDGIVVDRSLIKVRLQGARPDIRRTLPVLESRLFRLPDGFMPRAMTVEDACVTNCDLVWLLKHFYL